MSKILRSQSGMIPVVEVIILVLLLAVGGAVIYNVQRAKNVAPAQQATSMPKSADSYINIKEFGLRFKNNSPQLKDLHYSYNPNFDAVYLGTDSLANSVQTEKNQFCGISDGSLGAIGKYQAGASVLGGPIEKTSGAKKLGNYYYLYEAPQGPCADPDKDKAATDLQNKQIAVLKADMDTLELDPASTASTASEEDLKIAELGVKFKITDTLKGLTYDTISTSNFKVVGLTTPSLLNADSRCSAKSGALGLVSRAEGDYPKNPDLTNASGQLVKQFNGFYIGYTHPQATCSDVPAAKDLQDNQISALRSALNTVSQ